MAIKLISKTHLTVYPTLPYLSSSLLVEHKARHRSLHRGLSMATSSAALQLCHPISSLSFFASRPFLSLLFSSKSLSVVRAFFCPLVSMSLLPWCHPHFLSSTRVLCISISWSVCLFFLSVVCCWSYSASIFAVSSLGTCSGMPHTSWCSHSIPTCTPAQTWRCC